MPPIVSARSLARVVDIPARLFDLARPGVAPPLYIGYTNVTMISSNLSNICCFSRHSALSVTKIDQMSQCLNFLVSCKLLAIANLQFNAADVCHSLCNSGLNVLTEFV